jgi:hypothetical protein
VNINEECPEISIFSFYLFKKQSAVPTIKKDEILYREELCFLFTGNILKKTLILPFFIKDKYNYFVWKIYTMV